MPVGLLVVAPRDVERADRVVLRPDLEQRLELPAPGVDGLLDGDAFEPRHVLPGPAVDVPARGAESMRTGGGRQRRDDDRLLDAGPRHLVEQAGGTVRPVAEPVRLSPPRAVGRERDVPRLGRERQAQRGGEGVHGVPPGGARQVDRLEGPRRRVRSGMALQEFAAVRLGEQGERDVAPRVDVVDQHQQLAEPRLPQVLLQQLRVAFPEFVVGRPPDPRAVHDLPQAPAEPRHRLRPIERRAEQPPPQAAAGDPPRRRTEGALDGVERQQREEGGDREHHEPRQINGQDRGREHGAQPRLVGRRERHAEFHADEREEVAGRQDHDRHGQRRHRQQGRRERRRQHPRRAPQRGTPAVGAARAAAAPQTARRPQPGSAVDGGEHRSDRADPAPGHQIDLDAGLHEGAQDAGVIGPGGAGAGQDERRPQLRDVPANRVDGRHGQAVRIRESSSARRARIRGRRPAS